MDIKTFICSASQELKHRLVHLIVLMCIFLGHSFRSIVIFHCPILLFVRVGTQSFCWGRRALACVFPYSRWWWWRARQNRQPSASWELYAFLWVQPIRLSHQSACVTYSVAKVSPAVCLQGVVEFSLCLLFAKLVSYTFLFWLPLYITKAGNSYLQSSSVLLRLFMWFSWCRLVARVPVFWCVFCIYLHILGWWMMYFCRSTHKLPSPSTKTQ